MSIVGSNNRLATPLSQKSGRIVSGPKNPTLPQLVKKFEPINSPADSAPSVAAGSTSHRVRTWPASPANAIGSGRPIYAPKARRKMRSASGRSFSLNWRIVISIAIIRLYYSLMLRRQDQENSLDTKRYGTGSGKNNNQRSIRTPFQAHTSHIPRHKEYTTRGKCRITVSQPLARLCTTPSTTVYSYARYSVGVVPNAARKV